MDDQTDLQLLRAYSETRSDEAFATLVRRHIDLVHSAAMRMVCDSHLAQDVTQNTFVALAKNAPDLRTRPVITGWLHRTAQNIAAQTIRTDVRRRNREQEATAMNTLLSEAPDASWQEIAPHLDAALGQLDDVDRDAVLLRYFEKKSAREMATQLGISDEAAQKRVSRAVERLREFFAKRGVTVGASGLVVVISANAVQAAPVGLALTISTAAALTGTTLATATTATAIKTIAMTTLQKTVITTTLAVVAGVGIYEARQASQLREQVQTLQQQQAPLTEQIEHFQSEHDEASNTLARLKEELAKNQQSSSELLKLRGEVGLLRRQAQESKQVQAKLNQPPALNDYPADVEEQQKRMQLGKMIDGKNYSAQLFTFADKNQGWLPTNWLQVADYSNDYPVSGTNDFEFVHKQPVNLRELGTNFGNTVVVREYIAWKTHDGKWRKIYGFADGHSQVVEVADGNFTGWKEQNTYTPTNAAK